MHKVMILGGKNWLREWKAHEIWKLYIINIKIFVLVFTKKVLVAESCHGSWIMYMYMHEGNKKNKEETHTAMHNGYHNSSINKQNCDLKYLQIRWVHHCTWILILSLSLRENV